MIKSIITYIISIHNDSFGDRIVAEYHNHYMAMYQKAAYQSTSDIDRTLSLLCTSSTTEAGPSRILCIHYLNY